MKNTFDNSYSAGKQSYLLLMTNPYVLEPSRNKWLKETAFGAWRHSLPEQPVPEKNTEFHHELSFDEGEYTFSWNHDTYEAMVVRLADDITWVIENLQDADDVHNVVGGDSLMGQLGQSMRGRFQTLDTALLARDTGDLYNYFIQDCVISTKNVQDKLNEDDKFERCLLRKQNIECPIVSLSEQGIMALNELKKYLAKNVFGDARTENRNEVLATILKFVADQLFGKEDTLPSPTVDWVQKRSRRYPTFPPNFVIDRAQTDPFFRLQLVLTIMSEMSDSDIFEKVGMGMI